MFKVSERIYRTTDGRLVRENDPDAAFLAYPAGQDLSDEEAQRFGLLDFGAKRAPQPADKLATRPRDKAVIRTNAKEQADA